MNSAAIKQMLQDELTLVRRINRKPIGKYFSLGHFVLVNGRRFEKKSPFPKDLKHGKMGMCFKNAAELAIRDSHYIYCEGYAAGIIPVLHAWCVDRSGSVIDPTWKDALGCAYFGIPFKTKFLIHRLMAGRTYGLIDAWEQRWPVLKTQPKEFLCSL